MPSDPAQERTARELSSLWEDEMKDAGYNALQIRRYREAELKRHDEANLRALAYTGWLLTNLQFLAERDRVREAWVPRVTTAGYFPALKLSPDSVKKLRLQL